MRSLAALLLLGACAAAPGTSLESSAVPPFPVGTEWRLIEVDGAPVQAEPGQRWVTLDFPERGRFRGHGGCNSYFGNYSIDGRTFIPAGTGATRIACLDRRGEIERALFEHLGTPSKWEFGPANTLVLVKDGRAVLRFQQAR